jgi:uncharacterized protein YjbJ (UPF0337 family)
MNEPYMKGKWNELKGSIQEKWGKLTDDDLDQAEGKREQLLGKIRQAYGRGAEQAEKELKEWEKQVGLR